MGQTLSMLDVQGTRFEVQPANDLERNGLQREEHLARARRHYSLSESETKILEHLVDHYLHVHESGIGRIVYLQELLDFFRYKTHWHNVQDALLMKEICTVIADVFISYSMNHSQDSQNSDQIALLDWLISAGCRGSMTACEFLRELQQIISDLILQQLGEGDQGPQPDSQAVVQSQSQQNLVLQQGEGDQGPQPDSQAPVSKHGGVDGSGPEPAPEPGDASDSQGQQGTSRKFV